METGRTSESAGWTNIGKISELSEKGRHILKVDGLQVALFETDKGLFAINNRCPHEGYPLLEGTLSDDCKLACNWHGWSFDLKTGKALQGRDPVRTYPAERRGGDVWIDLSPEPAAERADKAFAEFDEAMAEHDYSRIARSLSRLEKADVSLESVAVRVVQASLPALERGFVHAHAGLADWIDLAGDDNDLRLVAFLEAFGHFSWDGLFSPGLEVPSEPVKWDRTAYRKAIDGMDASLALALARGAFQAGLRFQDIKPIMLDFIFDHFVGFGHPAIYVEKLERLVAQLGQAVEETLVLQLTQYLCLTAREDLIPEFRGFSDYLKVEGGDTAAPESAAFVGKSPRQAMALTAASLDNRLALFDALVGAVALNMLFFDETLQDRVEQPIAQNIGWLDFTHALTFADAVRVHATENPAYWQSGLMQLACFAGRNAKYIREADWRQWHVEDRGQYLASEKAKLFDMDAGEYIYSVHRLKMVCAVERLAQHVSQQTGDLVFASLNRYLNSRLRHHHPARTAFQARQTVMREG